MTRIILALLVMLATVGVAKADGCVYPAEPGKPTCKPWPINSATTGTALNVTVTNAFDVVPVKPWRLVTELNNGQITVLHFATKAECELAKQGAEHKPVTVEEQAYSLYFQKQDQNNIVSNGTYMNTSTNIRHVACLDW